MASIIWWGCRFEYNSSDLTACVSLCLKIYSSYFGEHNIFIKPAEIMVYLWYFERYM